MKINEFIMLRRKELRLTYSEVADSMFYSPQAVYRMEQGKVRISIRHVQPLCKALNLSFASFFRMDLENALPYDEKEAFQEEKYVPAMKEILSRPDAELKILANELQVSMDLLKKWRKGESFPDVERYLRLCEILEVDPSSLYLGRIPNTYHLKAMILTHDRKKPEKDNIRYRPPIRMKWVRLMMLTIVTILFACCFDKIASSLP